MEKLNATAYLAAPGYERQLLAELKEVLEVHGRLVLARGPRQEAHWAQNVWLNPVKIQIRSVSDGALALRSIQRNWALCSVALHRRARLIQDLLPHVSAKPIEFPSLPPSAPLGSWSLLRADTILASSDCSSPFPHGQAAFLEFKVGPPTRAYLKLWEGLTLLGRWPEPGERCLDAGSSPGGWTWALARLGARVLSVDRAPLAPAVAKLPGVEYRKGSAFSILPPEGRFDWIFCDVVCYPERLWRWVSAWLESGACRNFVCTVKFQGSSRYGVIREFSSVPGSSLVHLWSNKHELTWMFPG
jgi:23S rRNA (cytidine2498-2'-O)-methyltransferase